MTISVRMNPGLEKELEDTAKLRGVSKSQFIIDAVERALGRKNPYKLLLQVRSPTAFYGDSSEKIASEKSVSARMKEKLTTQRLEQAAEWQAFHAAKKAANNPAIAPT